MILKHFNALCLFED